MRQFFLPDNYDGSLTLEVKGEDHHYLTRVLRLNIDSVIPGRDREGNSYSLKILKTGPEKTLIEVTGMTDENGSSVVEESGLPEITIYTSIIKGKKFDQIIRQATETGVNRIQPVISENTVVKLTDGDNRKKKERWEKIALEASQQCGNRLITEISTPVSLKDITLPKAEKGLFFHEKMLENKPLHMYLRDGPERLHLFFGPEGGFSPAETERFLMEGIMPVYLGGNVLRAETAVIYGTGAAMTILRELGSW